MAMRSTPTMSSVTNTAVRNVAGINGDNSKLLFKEAFMLEILAMSGWGLLIISPFIWRAIFNWYDEKYKDEP